MKRLGLIVSLCMITSAAGAQWLTDMSCNSQSSKIADKAITHFVNLETSVAVGMANAALMIDEKCGTARLLKVNAAQGGENGSRSKKLKELDTSSFTDQENAWYSILTAPEGEGEKARKTFASKYPKVPFFNYWADIIDVDGKDNLHAYVKEFPKYASAAYNIMSYRYAQGYYGEPDMDKAIETVKKVFLTHDGPNAHDSMAEHYAEKGDFESAFKHQIMAVDYAAGPANGYRFNAGIYFRHTNQATVTDSIKSRTKRRVAYQTKNDFKGLSAFYSDEAGFVACNSNMEPCTFYASLQEEEPNHTWNRWNIRDLKVYFSPDMRMAITTFNSDGEYTMKGSETSVQYKTRASEVWILDNGWKLVHSNFAPLSIGSGIPKSK